MLKPFRRTSNIDEVSRSRRFETRDIVKRLGVLSPTNVRFKNHPIEKPLSIFNAAAILKDDYIYVYARVVMGYYMYISAIALVKVPLSDVLSGKVTSTKYLAELTICPSNKYDVWGVEDPRVTAIDNKWCMVFTGRTIDYFNQKVITGKTYPVVAVKDIDEKENWRKVGVVMLPEGLKGKVISDKDSFIIKSSEGDLLVFHRPHMKDGIHYTVISKLQELPNEGMRELKVTDSIEVLKPAPFEYKIGWGTPPINIGKDRYVMILHGVDREIETYRAFAALVTYDKAKGPKVISTSPYYIMGPKEIYEVYGDRPLVVFPCGFFKVDNKALVVYGAADHTVGFGVMDLNELVGILEEAAVPA
ncbi:MAG: glycosidase [Thermoprotei archaeon]|nr:MAG: glycosidase [Thermoprotei archaeon]